MVGGQSPLYGVQLPLCIPSPHLSVQRSCGTQQEDLRLSPCFLASKSPILTGPTFQRASPFIPPRTAIELHYPWVDPELQGCQATTLSLVYY